MAQPKIATSSRMAINVNTEFSSIFANSPAHASAAINCIGTLAVVSHCDAQDGKGRNPFGLTF